MTQEDYTQLKAYARIDGALVALMWAVSFGLYIAGIARPSLMMGACLVGVASPFYAARRLKRFRDQVREGSISFGRAYLYAALIFGYAALLLAVVQLVYFQFLDKGYFASQVMAVADNTDTIAALKAAGMEQAFKEAVQAIVTIKPIDYALNYLVSNIFIGLALALPIAAVTRRRKPQTEPKG